VFNNEELYVFEVSTNWKLPRPTTPPGQPVTLRELLLTNVATMNATPPAVDNDLEADEMTAACPPSTENGIGPIEAETLRQEESDDDRGAGETLMRRLPGETNVSRENGRTSSEYSFVNTSGVLHPVPVESSNGDVHSLSTPTIQATPLTNDAPQSEDTTPTQPATLEVEGCGNESDTVIVNTVQEDCSDQPAMVVSAERVTGTMYFTETATVVETFDDCSDDAVIRKILQEDLIASGRSTDELQEYIRTASLENVASRMSRAAEEEKTEIAEPDSALAWALHEQELSMSNLPVEHEHVAVATMPNEEATVVRITEHDVHPAEFESSDARAELIGEDYSLRYDLAPDAIDTPQPSAATVTAIQAMDEEAATEATVLDSKPAAAARLWPDETAEEATVLETKPPAVETWSRTDDDAGEVSVDAIIEEVASVVDITEDVHPAEFEENDVQATFIGREYTSTVAIEDQESTVDTTTEEEGLVVGIADVVHPVDFEGNETHATLVVTDDSRAVSYSTPPAQRRLTAARAVSEPPRNAVANPVDDDTSNSFHHGIAALDALEQETWMYRPSSFIGDHIVMPPPDTPAATPMAAAEVMCEVMDSDTCSDVPPLPPRMSVAGREPPRTSSARTEESERSSGTTGSGRRAAAPLQLVRHFRCAVLPELGFCYLTLLSSSQLRPLEAPTA